MTAFYRMGCSCEGFSCSTRSEFEARKIARFHQQTNENEIHQIKILAGSLPPAQTTLEMTLGLQAVLA